MRLLANENFPLTSVHLLRQQDHDVVSIAERSPREPADRLLKLLQVAPPVSFVQRFTVVTREQVRQRPLPISPPN